METKKDKIKIKINWEKIRQIKSDIILSIFNNKAFEIDEKQFTQEELFAIYTYVLRWIWINHKKAILFIDKLNNLKIKNKKEIFTKIWIEQIQQAINEMILNLFNEDYKIDYKNFEYKDYLYIKTIYEKYKKFLIFLNIKDGQTRKKLRSKIVKLKKEIAKIEEILNIKNVKQFKSA